MEFAGDGSDVAPTRIVSQESSDGGQTWGRHRVLTVTTHGISGNAWQRQRSVAS